MISQSDSKDRPSDEMPGSLPPAYFEELYARSVGGDPWRFCQSPYEAAKYAATLGHLPRARYRRGLEVGCSIGVFTHLLADRVDDLSAIDIVAVALDQARVRCQGQTHVRFDRADPLHAIPVGPFDLIVLSEVGYYWSPAGFDRVFRGLCGELADAGQIILVHWREAVPDYPQTGEAVHEQATSLAVGLGLTHTAAWVELQYRTDLWERPPRINPGLPS